MIPDSLAVVPRRWWDPLGVGRNVAVLTYSSTIGTFGNSLSAFFMPLYFLGLGASTALTGLTFTLAVVASSVGAFWAGSLADRLGRKPVLVAVTAASSALMLVLALNPAVSIAALAYAGFSFASGAGIPARQALLASSVDDAHRTVAYAFWQSISGSVAIAGPVLGGLLWSRSGFSWLLYLGSAFLFGATLLRWAGLVEPAHPASSTATAPPKILEGIALIAHDRLLAILTVVGFVTAAFGSMANFVVPIFSAQTLGFSDVEIGSLFSVLAAAFTITPLIGAKFSGRAGPMPTLVVFGSLSVVPEFAFTFARSFGVAALAIGLWSGLDGFVGPSYNAWFLTATPAGRRASVQGVSTALNQLASIPFPLLGGLLFLASNRLPFYLDSIATLAILAGLYRFAPRGRPFSTRP